MAEGSFAETSDGTKSRIEEMSGAMDRLTFLSAKDEPSAEGCASSSSDPSHSSSKYFSTRIQSIMESRETFETSLEAEIEASRVHWSEVRPAESEVESEAQGCAEANMRVFRSLQQQYAGPKGSFFRDWDDNIVALGEKIAEGGQAAIHGVKFVLPEDAHMNDKVLVKVMKLEGWSLENLQNLWPPGMLLHISNNGNDTFYDRSGIFPVGNGVMLEDGLSFGFVMMRCWGDLRKAIDLRMQHNGNQAPPFSNESALGIMHRIAVGMRGLHADGILHRDLKASNVLIWPNTWDVESEHAYGEFDVTSNNFTVYLADFECSVGVVGTGFWRAPEILQGLKNRDRSASLWSEKSDVYSYAMTCYEILTGKIPFEHLRPRDFDAVLHGLRPTFPSSVDRRIQALLDKCWHHDPSERPSFDEVVDMVKTLRKCF